MDEILQWLLATALLAFGWYMFLNWDRATDVDKAGLIEACGGDADAEQLVRETLKRPNLQRRHCRVAAEKVRRLLTTKQAKERVEKFMAHDA